MGILFSWDPEFAVAVLSDGEAHAMSRTAEATAIAVERCSRFEDHEVAELSWAAASVVLLRYPLVLRNGFIGLADLIDGNRVWCECTAL